MRRYTLIDLVASVVLVLCVAVSLFLLYEALDLCTGHYWKYCRV